MHMYHIPVSQHLAITYMDCYQCYYFYVVHVCGTDR